MYKLKFNKLFFAGLILLAIITLGAVSASDESDNMTATDIGQDSVSESVDEVELSAEDGDVLGGDVEIADKNIKVNAPTSIKACQENEIQVSLPKDAEGYITQYVDNEEVGDTDVYEGQASIGMRIDKLGLHTVGLKYWGDDKYGEKVIWSHDYNVKDFIIGVNVEDAVYGEDGTIDLRFPYSATGNVTVKLNGKTYTEEIDSYVSIRVSDLKYGDNKFTVSYSGDAKHHAATANGVIAATPQICLPAEAPYNTPATVNLTLPSNAKGTLVVNFNGKKYTGKFTKGFASVSITTKLNFGYYDIEAYYDGSDYDVLTAEESIGIVPKIVLNDYMWIQDNNKIVVQGPTTAKGTVNVEVDNEQFAKVKMSKGKAEISLKNLEAGEREISIYYSEGDFEYGGYSNVYMISQSPDSGFDVNIDDAILRGSDFGVSPVMPEYASGDFAMYIDGVKYEVDFGEDYYDINSSSLSLGKHTVKFELKNDPYYKNSTKTYSFDVADVIINIPKHVVINGRQEFVEIFVAENVTGNITILADGKKYKFFPILHSHYYRPGELGDGYYISLAELDMKNHKIEVKYSGDKLHKAVSKSANVDMSYELSLTSTFFYYDETIEMTVPLPLYSTENITVAIDGKAFKKIVYNRDGPQREAVLNVSKLTPGNHTVKITYPGDSKYARKTVSETVEVYEEVDFLNEIRMESNSYNHGKTYVFLETAKDAKGKLIVEFNGKTSSAALKNGFANITLGRLAAGHYELEARYDGDDYNIDDFYTEFDVGPYYEYEMFDANNDGYFYIELPKDTKGSLTAYIDGNLYKKLSLSKGKANMTISPLIGDHDIRFVYEGSNYEFSYDDSTYVDFFQNMDDSAYVGGEFNFNVPKNAKGKLTVMVNGKEYSPKNVNGNVSFIPSNLKVGKNSFIVSYEGNDYGNLSETYSFWVDPKVTIGNGNPVTKWAMDLFDVSQSDVLTIDMSKKFSGKYIVLIDNDYFTEGPITGGVGKISFKDAKTGIHTVFIDYEYEKNKHDSISFYALIKKSADLNVEVSDINVGDNATIEITSSIAKGNVIVSLNNENHTVAIEDGKGHLSIGNLKEGTYQVSVRYAGDSQFAAQEVSDSFAVKVIPPRIVAKNLSMLYTAGSKFKATVYGNGGVIAANVDVVIKINGKKVKTIKTNGNGVASYKITKAPGTYKITAEALGASVTKKVTVKHIVTLKKVVVKRSAKKLVLTATLKKVNGKYLKAKKVTFKFKGKTYKAKTNKKGVAKVTIKKSVLKKLKVGKKVTYQATYLKDTVKRTVKIKK